LPSTTAYTWAAELTADEAPPTQVSTIRFNKDIYVYLDNFIGFPTGTVIPGGFDDYQKFQWIPSKNGRVVEIVGRENGLALLDLDGDGQQENLLTYAMFGFTDEERQLLANRYNDNKTLWRMPTDHFSTMDGNLANRDAN